MTRAFKRKLSLGVAIAALVTGGAIAAVSATGKDAAPGSGRAHHATHRGAGRLVGVAAGYLGISQMELRSELKSGKTLAQVASATSGKSEAGLIEALVSAGKAKLSKAEANLSQRVSAAVNRPLRGAAGARRMRGAHTAARRYLDLSNTQLRSELLAGKTLAEVANSIPGKSEAGLIEAIVAAKSKRLSAAVSSGKLTKAGESADLARTTQRVKAAVNRVHAKKSR